MDLLIILSHKHWINMLWKIDCCRIIVGGCFRSFFKFCMQSFRFFQKVAPYPHLFFPLNSFLWKGLLTVKVRKKIIDQILGYISFCFEAPAHLDHLFAWTPKIIEFNGLSCSKHEPGTMLNIYLLCKSVFARKTP